jgi:O-antigen/teichoic acid export membrane protein
MFEKFFLLFSIGELVRNKSIQNFIFLAIIQSSNILISIISMPLLIQNIGLDQYGLVNLSFSVVVLVNIVVNYGFNLSAPRDVAMNQKNKKELSYLVSTIFSAKLILAFISCAIILLAIFGFDLFKGYQVILTFSLFLLFSEAIMPLWFFQGMEKMKLVSIANIFSKLLFLVGIVLFISNPDQAIWVNLILGGSAFAINLSLMFYIHYQLGITFYKPRLNDIFKSIHENTLFFLSLLASHISVNGGLIILSFFANATVLGMFSLAEKIGLVLRMVPSLVIQATYPNATKIYTEDKQNFYRFLQKISIWATLIGALISFPTYILAPFLIKILSKKELPEAVSFLRILAFVPLLASINNINVILFLVKGQKTLLFKSSWLMSVYMLMTSFLLTHFYGGIGLSYALVSAEVFIFLTCLYYNFKNNKEDLSILLNISLKNE